MKLLIVGAGIIGSIYGWAFSEAGHEVTHFVRPGKSAQLAHGYPIDMLDKRPGHKRDFRGHYPIRVTETLQPNDGFELVIVPTKHYHLLEALKQIVPLTGGADYLLLTQNWLGSAEIDAILPPSHYLFGDAKAGGCFRNGRLIATIKSIDLGPVGGRQVDCLDKTAALFRSADVTVTRHGDIMHYLWVQYALTGGLWPALVKAGSFETLLNHPRDVEQSLSAARECLEVAAGRGVDLEKYPEINIYLSKSFLTTRSIGLAAKWIYRFDKYRQRCSAHALSDPEEVKVFFYDLLNTGKEQGLSMPTMSGYEPAIKQFSGGKS